jgi:putative PIN family toxin of toxin-antitoxin system
VLDINVLASGFVSRTSIPGQLLFFWTYGAFALILSEHILSELHRTLQKPYFRERLTQAQLSADLALLRSEAIITPIRASVQGVATHPEDDVVLATAVSGKADYLVTSDKKLQPLGSYQGVTIVSPSAFLQILNPHP